MNFTSKVQLISPEVSSEVGEDINTQHCPFHLQDVGGTKEDLVPVSVSGYWDYWGKL